MPFPFGRWVWIDLSGDTLIAFVYLDPSAGPSARGDLATSQDIASLPTRTVRLWQELPLRELTAAELAERQLPARPDWLVHYGPQPGEGGAAWRNDPLLSFHPDYPDDLQVVVHDGDPRRTKRAPELCWVRITGAVGDGLYRGELLNQPHGLETVKLGDTVTFIATKPRPLQVSDAYLRERPLWTITPCDKCGAGECFDPPSAMIRVRFPDAPAGTTMKMFTSFCTFCGGTQQLERRPD